MATKLGFKKAIILTVSDPIPTKEVLLRLQKLLEALEALDQDKVDLKSVANIKDDLANKKLIKNNNLGIQVYTCCCIAEILRLFAPDAPYTASELSMIFKTIFGQLKRIGDGENPYFQQQSYLLKLLSEVRSIILITDLPDHETLIDNLFEVAYDLTKSSKFTENLLLHMSDILSEVISESESISSKVLKLILGVFLQNDTSALTGRAISNPGLVISIHICEANVDRMLRQVAKLFSETLYEGIEGEVLNSSEKLRKIHKVIVQLWKSVPEMLVAIMGLVDEELKADDQEIRVLATETVGSMIGSTEQINKVNFMINHKETWLLWLRKSMDASPLVRCKWVEQISTILAGDFAVSSEHFNELVTGYIKCLLDVEERVRFSACRALDNLGSKTMLEKLCTKDVLNTLIQLIREKNPEIRNEILKILGGVYNTYLALSTLNEIVSFGHQNTEEECNEIRDIILRDIPNNILSLIYINDKEITASVDAALFEVLLPLETNTTKRVERLCQFFASLNEKSKNSFVAITKRQQQVSKVVLKYLDLANTQENKENKMDFLNRNETKNIDTQKLDKTINWMCVSFPDGLNTFSCLERFNKLKNHRFFYLLRMIVSSDSDYATVKNSLKELLTKLGSAKNLKLLEERTTVSTTDMVSNFKLLLFRAGMILFNRSNIAELLKFAKDPSSSWYTTASDLLENISTTVPDVFQTEIESLKKIILSKDDIKEDKSNVLKILYHLVKKFPALLPKEKDFIDELKVLSLSGNLAEVKFSIKILGLSPRKELHASYIFDGIFPLKIDDNNFSLKLCAIAELYLIDPVLLEEKSSEITTLLIKEILLKNSPETDSIKSTDAITANSEWIAASEYESHPNLLRKLLTLKIFVNRLKSYKSDILTTEECNSTAELVLKLLSLLIGNGGEIVNDEKSKTPTPYQVQLRYHAGLHLLKLAKIPHFETLINTNSINKLIYLVQDQNLNVRSGFLAKLQKYLSEDMIPDRFLHLVFFVAYDPSIKIKQNTTNWVQSFHKRQEKRQQISCEAALLRLVHSITHMQEFQEFRRQAETENDQAKSEEMAVKSVTYAMDYLIFYVKTVAKSENVSLLYYFASRIKQYRDATIDQKLYDLDLAKTSSLTLDLYCVAELGQLVVSDFCDYKGWSMQSWPGKVKLSAGLFAPMKSTREAQFVISQLFISDTLQAHLKKLIKYKLSDNKKRHIDINKLVKPVKKARAVSMEPEQPTRRSTRLRTKVVYKNQDHGSDDD